MHESFVKMDNGQEDPRYVNMCVEQWDYTPVKLHVVLNKLRERGVLK